MAKTTSKRLISLLLVVMMVVSFVPVQAFALESSTENTDQNEIQHMEPNPFVKTVLLKEVKSKIDTVLGTYLGTTIMSKEDVENIVSDMDDGYLISSWEETSAIVELIKTMTDAEVYFLKQHESTETFGYFYASLNEICNSSAVTDITVSDTIDSCMSSGEVLVAQAVDACEHIEVIDPAKASTCTQTGLTEGKHCSVCGEVLVAQAVVPVKMHTPGAEATCTTAQTCTVCGTILVNAIDHVWTDVPGKAPGRTENGYEPYITCEECGAIDGEIVVIPALGEASISSYDELIFNLALLEEIASMYVKENPGKNPIALVIKYIRTGVDRYNSGSWGIMAGYEDADFAKYVKRMEDTVNAEVTDGNYLMVTGLKNINNFQLPNGDNADIGHVFGAMDITYHNKGSQNHADVSGWAGDLVDLLEFSDMVGVSGDIDTMIKYISENLLGKVPTILGAPSMSQEDIYGDLDAYYIMYVLNSVEEDYVSGTLTEILMNYFTEDLSIEQRAAFFLRNRLETTGTRAHVRNAVYTEYAGNKLIATLEGTREFQSNNLFDLRKAVCYSFADYICKLAGDYVEKIDNPYYNVFTSNMSVLAPGITQEYYQATTVDGKQMVYYVATADITRDDVHVFANYHNAAPEDGWAMQRVKDQANAAQAKYGDPNSPDYIPNYNVIISTNADGYNMTTGEPGGLLIMNGKEWHGIDNGGFFGITKEGKAVIGTKADYNNTYKGQLADAVGGFGTMLIRNGEIAISKTDDYYNSRAPRTAVGITKTGKVVLMVLDGRQEPYSCGGSMQEIAQIMFEAGCVDAVNLDGGGSTTFVAKQQGEEELTLMNKPSDGAARSVSTSLLMVSTAPSSTAFDHANLESDYSYATIGTPVQITPVGISATGNITDLPEGYTWAVSNERWAAISQDGVFTGKRNGSVDVYLMFDGAIIGSKTMNIVVPETIYFTKNTVDAVYGSTVKLPIAALCEGKQVAINTNDIDFVLDNAKAGTIDGFNFTAAETSSIKVAKITASLNTDSSIVAVITVSLYKQGENSFDFDKATGGDRLLAWDRIISNSTTTDGMSFVAVDTDEEMVTSYIFAMDMSQIPIPAQLADLVYMLPGADMADASAWNFLLQLAERVSTLTEVTPVLHFDSDVDVDYSELKILNDYFELVSTDFDEAANTLSLKLKWIDRTAAIDPATANPLCLVSGIKLTPKADANWDSNKRLQITHAGKISYKIYLRANALYSFALKPENQQIFGLIPFVNPDLPSESGAYFSNVYKEFEDSYTLVNALKNGWYAEDGGFAYYIQGVKMAGGVKEADGYYYYFDDHGINIGQVKYTGVFRDDRVGSYFYAKNGVLEGGWQSFEGNWYYFDKTTLKAVNGKQKLGGVTYEFDGNGRLKSGVWVNVFVGWRYYYGPDYYRTKWQEIDGEWYYFRDGVRVTGKSRVTALDNTGLRRWYDFGEDGASRGLVTGIVNNEGELYWCEEGKEKEIGLFCLNGDYYYSHIGGKLITNQRYYAWLIHESSELPKGHYDFGADGKMLGVNRETGISGIVEKDGNLYYYENGNPTEKFLFKYNGDYYYSRYNGQLVVNTTYYAYKVDSNCDLPVGHYEFGPDGKMLNGIVEKNGELYYYENGVGIEKGLFLYDGNYYCAKSKGKLAVNESYYAWKLDDSCNLPKDKYDFDENGRLMLNGIVNKGGVLYYYENGKPVEKGLFKYEDEYYYSRYNGALVVNERYYAYKADASCDLPAGHYEFGADGKMLRGIVEKNGVLYFYENGNPKEMFLFEYEGAYYYSRYNGALVVNDKYYAYKTNANCDLPVGHYEFGPDGKMLQGIVEKNGVLYFYENGNPKEMFLFEYEGAYYYSRYNGALVVNDKYYAYKINANCDLPVGHYEFGPDGKMLQGIVEKNGVLYFYENGNPVEKGLFKYEDNYYYSRYDGSLITGKSYYAYKIDSSCDLPVGHYEFGADGKMLNGIVEKNGKRYYYENGQAVEKGLFIMDGYYYYARYDGMIITNQTYYVWLGNGLLFEKNYVFNELGQIIG